MKLFAPLSLFLVIGSFLSLAQEESSRKKKAPKRQELDGIIFSQNLWEKPLAEIKAAFAPEQKEEIEADSIPEEVLTALEKAGIDVDTYIRRQKRKAEGPFQWLSSQKMGIRSPGKAFTLLGMDLGEVIMRSKGKGTSDVSISVYNRGDDRPIGKGTFEERMSSWRTALSAKLGVRPEDRDQSGRLQIDGSMWKTKGTAWLLEGSVNRRENRVEFIRLRIASLSASGNHKKKVTRRRNLVDNVSKEDNGDVYIANIPMVDQGEKGYCVVATVERVIRYFGSDVDQHEMASLANTTGDGGTSTDDMVKAFQRITGKVHARTIKHIDYDIRQFEKDFKSYNRLAKKENVWYDRRDFDNLGYISLHEFFSNADKDVFRTIKAKQTKFDHFNRKIKQFIDEGVPLCWTLYLGMFPEKGLPQSWGGHMRLIIGYNEKTEEIIYSDSWGEGHEMKRMRADEAWSMSTGLYSMVPNR